MTNEHFYRTSISTAIPQTDPDALNSYYQLNHVYQESARNSQRFTLVDWVAIKTFTGGLVIHDEEDSGDISLDNLSSPFVQSARQAFLQGLDNDLARGIPAIIRVNPGYDSKHRRRSHFMLVVGKCNGRYIVSDPGPAARTSYDPNDPKVLFWGVRRFREGP